MKYFKKNKTGYTLIEIIVILMVMIILFGIGAQILNTTLYSWDMITLRKDMLFSGRLGITRMLREIRHADISKIKTFDPTHFVFADLQNRTVDLKLDGTNLLRNTKILADNLQKTTGVHFTYLDPNGNAASLATAIHQVKIRLNLQKEGQALSLESRARIRNL